MGYYQKVMQISRHFKMSYSTLKSLLLTFAFQLVKDAEGDEDKKTALTIMENTFLNNRKLHTPEQLKRKRRFPRSTKDKRKCCEPSEEPGNK